MLEDEFGDVIAKARVGRGWSTAELARRSGIQEGFIGRLEAYKGGPSDDQVARLASELGLRAGPLLELARKAWEPQKCEPSDPQRVESLKLRSFSGFTSNTHLIWHEPARLAVVIDPGFEPQKVLRAVVQLGLRVVVVAITHGHHDHVGAVSTITRHFRVSALIGGEDLSLVSRPDRKCLDAVADGDHWDLEGGLQLDVVAAPGHTPGGRCYVISGACFVGDTLFAGSIGRTFGGPPDYPVHLETVRARILGLPPNTRLYPGHGPNTTVAQELVHNPFA